MSKAPGIKIAKTVVAGIGFFFLFLGWLFPAYCGEHGIAKEDLAIMLRTQRESIDTIHFRFVRSAKTFTADSSPLARVPENLQYLEQEEARSGNMRRYSIRAGRTADDLRSDNVTVWNEKVLKNLYGRIKRGHVQSEPGNYRFEAANSPLTASMLIDTTQDGARPDLFRDIVALLETEVGVVERETSDLDGVECVTVTMDAKGHVFSRVWLDPNRGFAVLRRVQYNPDDLEQMLWDHRNLELKDCGNGLWLPTRTTITKYVGIGHPVREEWGKRSLEFTFVASTLKVNEDLPEELFDIEFPEGTYVTDTTAGVSYRQGMEKEKIRDALDEIFDEPIEPDVESNVVAPPVSASGEADATITESPEVAGTDDNRENGSSPLVLRIIVLALAVILVGAAVSVVLLLRKRSRIR